MVPPPLIGDEEGRYRVHSTVGKELARVLNVPFIPLDALHWKPGWVKSTDDEVSERLEQLLADANGSWVVDGNHRLDPPLALYFPRLLIRTFLRMLRLSEPCRPGCTERAMEVFFSKDSVLWWCLTHHRPLRARENRRMAMIGIGVGSDVRNQKMHRLGGWGGELRAWKAEVQRMVDRT
ncbi:hypothetical protein C8J57DRAFT_1300723 [Mycena rebaudengoi]|nr:hypothetical protein C8J57DRAFT_1300723 [Mycena rebaudengoi]